MNAENNVFPPHNLVCPISGLALPPNLGGYQQLHHGTVSGGDIFVDGAVWTWAYPGSLGTEAMAYDEVRIYRKIPVPTELSK